MGKYQELIVWQKSMSLVESVYKISSKLPKAETYALGDQMRRAAVSIPSNIAEGQRRGNVKEVIQFSSIAFGSLAELETQLILEQRLHGVDTNKELEMCGEIGLMLASLIAKLRSK